MSQNESHVGAGEARIWAGRASKIQTLDGSRHTGMEREHCQTMVRVLKTVFAPRLRELARQVNPARAQQVLNWAWRAQRVETWTDHADEVLIEAQAEERVAEQRRRTHATKTYSQWLESALRKVAGVAHRWTTQTITSAHSMDYQNSTTPQQSMQARTWGDRWNRDNEARHILMRQMQLLRQQALSTTPHNWTAESVRHTLSSMKGNRAGGIDGWTPSEMLRLPTKAIDGLAGVLPSGGRVSCAPNTGLHQRGGLARLTKRSWRKTH